MFFFSDILVPHLTRTVPLLRLVEQAVYAALDSTPIGVDELAGLTGLSVQELASTLTVLELKQMVCKLAGSGFVRKR